MKDTLGPWTAEFSHSQQCFNVDTLESHLKRNIESFREGRDNDWILLAIMDKQRDAHAICNYFRDEKGIPTVFERFAKEHLS